MNGVRSYSAVHAELRRRRGSARWYLCHWCGTRAARQWACRCDSSVVTGRNSSGRSVTYSTDIDDYVASCLECHRLYDAQRTQNRRRGVAVALPPRMLRPVVAHAGSPWLQLTFDLEAL